MEGKVHAIENTLGEISASLYQSKAIQDSDLAGEIENRIKPLENEVKSIREEILPQLETSQDQLKKIDDFVRKNVGFFVSVLEGEGVISNLSNQLSSVEKRLNKVESQVNISRDRIIAVIAVVLALTMACITFLGLAWNIYSSTIG